LEETNPLDYNYFKANKFLKIKLIIFQKINKDTNYYFLRAHNLIAGALVKALNFAIARPF
jgi:hypothetical protein